MNQQEFSAVTPEFERLAKLCESHDVIDPELYTKYQVKRGLRDLDGKGVLTGLTEISTIISSEEVNGVTIPIDGQLYYRGINIYDLVRGFTSEKRFGFEETVYLLLFGELPNKKSLQISTRCSVPTGSCHIICKRHYIKNTDTRYHECSCEKYPHTQFLRYKRHGCQHSERPSSEH